MPDFAALAAVARGLLPACVAVAASDPTVDLPPDPDTPPAAVPKRAREFAAGRAAARAALAMLDVPPVRIPMSPDRAPLWPEGIAGSISHSARACLAAVARRSDLLSLGLDVEDDARVTPDIWSSILLPEERDWLDSRPAIGRNSLATMIFSAKEAAFKAQYPVSRVLFGFEALCITLAETGRFSAEFRQPAGAFATGQRLHGQGICRDGHILTAVVLPNP